MSRTNCAIGTGYVTASFKGVLFQALESDAEGGRRGAEGEFPFGEETAYADLGRKIRLYHITAVFREDSHIADSQALFEVCQTPQPGMLVHPTRGTVMVACRSVKVSDNSEEQGETHVSLEFVEANTGGASGLGGSIFGIISTGLNAIAQATFLSDYAPNTVSQPWRSDVIHTAQHLVSVVTDTMLQTMPPDLSVQTWRNIMYMQAIVQDDGLAADPKQIDNALRYGFTTITANVTDPPARYNTMRKLANAAATVSTLPAGAAQTSEEAVLRYHRILAAVGMAEAAMATRYPTIDAALTAMDATATVLDGEAESAYGECDDALFLELRNYTTQFRKMMNDLAYRLPPVIVVNFVGGVQPLIAAYAIYKDAKRHRELEPSNTLDANGRFRSLVVATGTA